MASKRQIAIIASALALLPPAAIAEGQTIVICDPDKVLTKCEKSLYNAGIVWESRAESTRASLNGCLDKLAVRTATVVNKLVLPPAQERPEGFSREGAVLLSSIGMVGFVIGLLAGVALSR
jgi:hypothetical protein